VPHPESVAPMEVRWRKFALAIFLTAYFLYCNWGSLRVHFAIDELANIRYYFDPTVWQNLLANFLPWRGDYRPFGAWYYLPVYHFAGLDPAPYQAVLLVVLMANVYFAHRLVRLLGAGELPAAVTAMVCCYHGGLANLYYNAAFIYDGLCCCFYLAALSFYVKIRGRGKLLGGGQTVVFLALALAAMNSKEMAVSIAVMMLIYEMVYHPPAKRTTASLKSWALGPARTVWIAAGLSLLDVYGKVAGPGAMAATLAYRPVFTLERARACQVALMQDLLLAKPWTPGWFSILGFYAVLARLAWRRPDRPILRFFFWFLLIVPLPIEFLEGRREACFALPMVALTAFGSVILLDAAQSAARFLTREFKLPVRAGVLTALIVAGALLLWVREQNDLRRATGGEMAALGQDTWDIIQQMRANHFRPRPGSSVAFLDDPFHSLDMYTLARLWFHDRSVKIHGNSQGPLTADELAKMDYVFTVENRKLIRIR
jgi:hypothetical protein